MRTSSILIMFLLAAGPVAAQAPIGYAGEQTREIKSLAAQEQADLLAGRGMGLARAGELNHYPGPAHVLELRDKLSFSPEQIAIVEASFRRMLDAARPLGAELVERERLLDAAFREGTVTPARLREDTEAIGALQGRLRAVHLAAHIHMRSALTPGQVATYDALRGYTDTATAPSDRRHHVPPG